MSWFHHLPQHLLDRLRSKSCMPQALDNWTCLLVYNCMMVSFHLVGQVSIFKNENSQHQTALSKYIWKLKKSNRHFNIKWSIWARAPPFKGGKSCRLCLLEKLAIAECPPRKLLNNRSEILSKCIHRHKFELRKKAASTKANQSQTNNNNAP